MKRQSGTGLELFVLRGVAPTRAVLAAITIGSRSPDVAGRRSG
jgi:hypothetical protein